AARASDSTRCTTCSRSASWSRTCPRATPRSVWSTRCGRRSRASSTTTSRSRRRTSISRCTPLSWVPPASRSRSRCAPRRCTRWPSTASRRTGATRRAGRPTAIVTSKAARGPSRDWIGMVRTPGAREKIRQWFKRSERDENITHGKELLDRELKRLAQRSLGDLSDEDLRRVTEALNMHDVDTLFASLGYGEVTAAQVVMRLGIVDDAQQQLPESAPPLPPTTSRGAVTVKGVDDLLVRFAVCCNPVPGDPIVGYITRGRGVTVHRDGR